MDSARIQELVKFIPEESEYFQGLSLFDGIVDSVRVNEVNKFLLAYKDLKFGWHFVRYLVKYDRDLPAFVDEEYIYRAYNFERYGVYDQDIIHIISLNHPANRNYADIIESMLLVKNVDIDDIVNQTGLPRAVVEGYEQLYFNVLDRKDELLWLSNIVYPESRFIEMFESYINNESLGMLLKRCGYNNGLEDVLYFSGLRTDILNSDNRVEMANRLESAIMTNGYFLARNGFINQRGATGLHNAKFLISATKQGGQDMGDEDVYGAGNMGESILNELMEFKAEETKAILRSRQLELDE